MVIVHGALDQEFQSSTADNWSRPTKKLTKQICHRVAKAKAAPTYARTCVILSFPNAITRADISLNIITDELNEIVTRLEATEENSAIEKIGATRQAFCVHIKAFLRFSHLSGFTKLHQQYFLRISMLNLPLKKTKKFAVDFKGVVLQLDFNEDFLNSDFRVDIAGFTG